jgi:hypothetical protein
MRKKVRVEGAHISFIGRKVESRSIDMIVSRGLSICLD